MDQNQEETCSLEMIERDEFEREVARRHHFIQCTRFLLQHTH